MALKENVKSDHKRRKVIFGAIIGILLLPVFIVVFFLLNGQNFWANFLVAMSAGAVIGALIHYFDLVHYFERKLGKPAKS